MMMKKMNMISAALAAILAVTMTGCSLNQNFGSTTSVRTVMNSDSANTEDSVSSTEPEPANQETDDNVETLELSQKTASAEQESELFTKRDLAQTADLSDAQSITVTDGQTIDITDEGVYVIRGAAKNCTLCINADATPKIQLVLDGVSIENSDFPAVYVLSADKVFITTTDSENTLTVSGQFRADGDTNTDAVIFSKDDLVLNGTGTLHVTSGSGNGITCKDDLKITGGTYNVSSALDSFEANDSISVYDGTFSIRTEKDGFHCENDEAGGNITILGGTYTISGGSDGMQACALLQIDGGTMEITAAEGLEATYVLINDGNITISASDDGINAAAATNAYETAIEINGGNLHVAVGQGDTDAVDSNGSIYVNGGTVDITAQMSSFDYDRTAEFNGGTIIINGQEVSEIPQSMMGGRGGMNGYGGRHGMQSSTEGGTDEMQGGMNGFSGRHGMQSGTEGGTEGMQGGMNGFGRRHGMQSGTEGDPGEMPGGMQESNGSETVL